MRNKLLVVALVLIVFLLVNQYDRHVLKTHRDASNESTLQYMD